MPNASSHEAARTAAAYARDQKLGVEKSKAARAIPDDQIFDRAVEQARSWSKTGADKVNE
jgi:hypothetical protein